MSEYAPRLAALVLAVHRRNGGQLEQLDFGSRLQAPELRLDSLDLAELMVAVEREFGVAPFDAPEIPRTWGISCGCWTGDYCPRKPRTAAKGRVS
ncbi:MAG: acyl carrier protein [Verrucomicrobia bacterium]|nr:acyl carrier protein [Verrucomicrobiota bacterium]